MKNTRTAIIFIVCAVALLIAGVILFNHIHDQKKYDEMKTLVGTFDTETYVKGSVLEGIDLRQWAQSCQPLKDFMDQPLAGLNDHPTLKNVIEMDSIKIGEGGHTLFPSPVAFLVQNGEDAPVFCTADGIEIASFYSEAKTVFYIQRDEPFDIGHGLYVCKYDITLITSDGACMYHIERYKSGNSSPSDKAIAGELASEGFRFSAEAINPLEQIYAYCNKILHANFSDVVANSRMATDAEMQELNLDASWDGPVLNECREDGLCIPDGTFVRGGCVEHASGGFSLDAEHPFWFRTNRALAYKQLATYTLGVAYTYVYERSIYDLENHVCYRLPTWSYSGAIPTSVQRNVDANKMLVYAVSAE